jgi:hypothetical protein
LKFTNSLIEIPKLHLIYKGYKLLDLSDGRDTYGMSGCGLLSSDPKEFVNGNNSKQLVAVMTNWLNENQKF